jgi:NADH dehydrogenase FAD-containing subunit
MKKIRVVIAAGRFAGLSAAMHLNKTLARCGAVEFTLISRENFILFTPMLHEVAAGDLDPGDIVNPIRRIVSRIKFVEAEVQRIDLSTRRIHCKGGVATRVASYDGSVVRLSDGQSIPASTLIWTAGVKPSAVIASLPCHKERGRLVVDEFLRVPGVPGLWAAGDCAAVPVSETEEFRPPTAQHGLRQGLIAARNIEAAILGRPLTPFIFSTIGQLATIGRRSGAASVFGIRFSGFIAWCLGRAVYLMKLPRLTKKLRVMVSWILDLFFAREIEQMITLRDVEAVSELAGRVRARAAEQTLVTSTRVPEAANHIQA